MRVILSFDSKYKALEKTEWSAERKNYCVIYISPTNINEVNLSRPTNFQLSDEVSKCDRTKERKSCSIFCKLIEAVRHTNTDRITTAVQVYFILNENGTKRK